MFIGLGGSGIMADSRHTMWMILLVQSFYFLSLGLCLVMYDQQLQGQENFVAVGVSEVKRVSAAPSVAADGSERGGVLTLPFLFSSGTFPSHPHRAVILVFLLHGLLLGSCVGCLVERRSWCLDVVLTAEAGYLVTTLAVAGTTGLGWRCACLFVDSVFAVTVALYIAGRREAQEIALGNAQV